MNVHNGLKLSLIALEAPAFVCGVRHVQLQVSRESKQDTPGHAMQLAGWRAQGFLCRKTSDARQCDRRRPCLVVEAFCAPFRIEIRPKEHEDRPCCNTFAANL